MTAFGSEEWAAQAAELWPLLPPAPGAKGVVSLGIMVAPRKEMAFHWQYSDGQPVGGGAGSVVAGDDSVTLTLSMTDAGEVLSGAVTPSVAFMRGRLKTAGGNGLLLAFLASTEADGFGEWLARLSSLAPT